LAIARRKTGFECRDGLVFGLGHGQSAETLEPMPLELEKLALKLGV